MRILSVVAALLVWTAHAAAAQDATRTLRRVPAPVGPSGQTQELYSASYALLIGVSKYDDPAAWASLDSVTSELADLKTALMSAGFDGVEQLTNPTGEELRRSVDQFIRRYGYNNGARLLFYFSGHGFTLDEGRRGYFVTRDAPDPLKDEPGFRYSALSMDQVATWARDITARHALFVFDSCFSGTIFRTRDRIVPQPISELTAKKVRMFMSAGGAGEPVPARSVFTPSFTRALRGAADLNRDGFVTGIELGNWVQAQVIGYATRQTPQFGKLRDPEFDEGDVVFAVGATAAPPPPPPVVPRPSPSGGVTLPPNLLAYQQKCDAGDASACTSLGFAYDTANGVALDPTRAAGLYQRGCDGGNMRGCYNLAISFARGEGVVQDRARAVTLYQHACDRNLGDACTNLGLLYEEGKGVAQSMVRAVEFYRRGCEQGSAGGCTDLADMYEHGKGVQADLARARELYRQGCDGKHARGCSGLASLYDNGRGVTTDDKLAAELYERACQLGNPRGCNNAGVMHQYGEGVPRDYAKAVMFFDRACDEELPRGCANLAELLEKGLGTERNVTRATDLYIQACKANDQSACNALKRLGIK
jgi:TPR repeat protein